MSRWGIFSKKKLFSLHQEHQQRTSPSPNAHTHSRSSLGIDIDTCWRNTIRRWGQAKNEWSNIVCRASDLSAIQFYVESLLTKKKERRKEKKTRKASFSLFIFYWFLFFKITYEKIEQYFLWFLWLSSKHSSALHLSLAKNWVLQSAHSQIS